MSVVGWLGSSRRLIKMEEARGSRCRQGIEDKERLWSKGRERESHVRLPKFGRSVNSTASNLTFPRDIKGFLRSIILFKLPPPQVLKFLFYFIFINFILFFLFFSHARPSIIFLLSSPTLLLDSIWQLLHLGVLVLFSL